MNFQAKAGELAAALAVTTAAIDQKKPTFAALGAVRMAAAGDHVQLLTNGLDRAVTTSCAAAVEVDGEVAVGARAFTGLIDGLGDDETVTSKTSDDGRTVNIVCGRRRYRLPQIPIERLPPMLTIDQELGKVELAREKLLHLLSVPLFAVEDDLARYYLAGILLKTVGGELVGVGTDGRRLVRVSTAFATGTLSEELIVPLASVKATMRLLAKAKFVETVTVRRSKSLVEITTPAFTLTSRLIDAQYPQYEPLIPKPSTNFAIVNRRELAHALARLAAVVDSEILVPPIIGLEWCGRDRGSDNDGALHLTLLRQPDAADDILDANAGGVGQVAVALDQLAELVDELQGEKLQFDFNGANAPVMVVNPDDDSVLALQMPIYWNFETAAAA
jgi:DNA polymerase-3 subunit beta